MQAETDVTDNFGNVTRQKPTTDFYYDLRGNAVGVTDAKGNSTAQLYREDSNVSAEYRCLST